VFLPWSLERCKQARCLGSNKTGCIGGLQAIFGQQAKIKAPAAAEAAPFSLIFQRPDASGPTQRAESQHTAPPAVTDFPRCQRA
jgi:hypothetical protein